MIYYAKPGLSGDYEGRRTRGLGIKHVLDVIQARLPEILPYAKKQLEGIQDAEILRHLIVKMSTAQTAEEAFQYLFTISDETKQN